MRLLKICVPLFAMFLFAFSAPVLAQHMHSHSDQKKALKENVKELPSGLSDSNTHQHSAAKDSVKSSHTHSGMMKHDALSDVKGKNSIIREGEIDLKAIDKNNDGKVFQDQMCWNVISDEPGKCPLCKMTLEEVSLKKAKENLLKNKFKVKS